MRIKNGSKRAKILIHVFFKFLLEYGSSETTFNGCKIIKSFFTLYEKCCMKNGRGHA